MKQIWHDLLFAHWPLPQEIVRPLIPPQLQLDTFDNQCWIGVIPFRMSGIRARGLPPLPGLSRTPELNMRTYVTFAGKPGAYFFSLDAASLPAVWAGRMFYHLPYFRADMRVTEKNGEIHYRSRRRNASAEFRGRYWPTGSVQLRSPGSLDHWLTERYCLYTTQRNRVYRCEIHHVPWPLQDADAEIELNTFAQADAVPLPNTRALLHFSPRQEALMWPLRRAD